MEDRLNVSELFLSLQGEGVRTGRVCAFVRLGGCNLRCRWCDTPYARQDGEEMSIDEVLGRVEGFGARLVEVTGGEPLAQPAALVLLRRLCDVGYETLLETNGSLDISQVDPRVARILDFKCPGSGEADRNLWTNVEHLTARDEVKFVLTGRDDYEFAQDAVGEHSLCEKCAVTFSPAANLLDLAELARWVMDDNLDVRVGVQLHRIIWPGEDRGV